MTLKTTAKQTWTKIQLTNKPLINVTEMGAHNGNVPMWYAGKTTEECKQFIHDLFDGKFLVQEKLDGIAIGLLYSVASNAWYLVRNKTQRNKPTEVHSIPYMIRCVQDGVDQGYVINNQEFTNSLVTELAQIVNWFHGVLDYSSLTEDVFLNFEYIAQGKANTILYDSFHNLVLLNLHTMTEESRTTLFSKLTDIWRQPIPCVILPVKRFPHRFKTTVLLENIMETIPKMGFNPDAGYWDVRNVYDTTVPAMADYEEIIKLMAGLELASYSILPREEIYPDHKLTILSEMEGIIIHTPDGLVKMTGEFTKKWHQMKKQIWESKN